MLRCAIEADKPHSLDRATIAQQVNDDDVATVLHKRRSLTSSSSSKATPHDQSLSTDSFKTLKLQAKRSRDKRRETQVHDGTTIKKNCFSFICTKRKSNFIRKDVFHDAKRTLRVLNFGEWRVLWSRKFHRWFYCNVAQGKGLWDMPEELQATMKTAVDDDVSLNDGNVFILFLFSFI